MSTDGMRLLSSFVLSGDTKAYAKMRLGEYLFKGSEVALYKQVQEHLGSYGQLPHPSTLEELGYGEMLVEAVEPPEYYLERVEARYLHTQMKDVVIQAQELLKAENAPKAFDLMLERVMMLMQANNRQHMADFRDSVDVVMAEYKFIKADGQDYLLKYGWPTLDNMTGGIREGDFITFIGRPGAGKTFQLLHCAHANWLTGMHTPLFFSMEMATTIIMQRLAAMHTHKPLSNLLKGMMSTMAMVKMGTELNAIKNAAHPLWLVDGNLATNVDDVVMQCRQLQPSVAVVDAAYLLRHPDKRIGKWDRISENAEQLKQRVATDLGIPVIASYQFKRSEKSKKKGAEENTMDDIYGSDAIAQLSTVMLGLFEDDNIETKVRRKINVLKGRNGETGTFKINWNFHQMDFSEIEEDTTQMQFLG